MHDSSDEPAPLTRRALLTSTVAGAVSTTLLSTSAVAQPAELPTTSRELWQWVRVQPVADSREAWLNTASIGPTLRVSMASEYRAREIQSGELPSFASGERWNQETLRLATRFALFAGCDADEVVFTRGAGEGLSFVANGLDLAAGDEVLTTSQEHPSALSPWLFQARRRGIVIKQIDLPRNATTTAQLLQAVTAGLTERTRVLAFSHVQYADGTVLPVKELCQLARERKVISVVDGAQAFGMLSYQLRDLGCDFYSACFHKWLGGSHGSGMLYVRREMLERIWPTQPRGIDTSPPVITPTKAIGYEATPAAIHRFGNIVPLLWPALRGSESALDLHDQVNRARIEARIRELVIYARLRLQQLKGVELLTPGAPGLWGGILSFQLPGRAPADVVNALARINRVHLAALTWPSVNDGALRLSLHMFNSHDELERMMQGLLQLPKL
ncbi:MAG: aminotransferase class V-fold PLP-dependent enzyme [Povalibacter sp.]